MQCISGLFYASTDIYVTALDANAHQSATALAKLIQALDLLKRFINW